MKRKLSLKAQSGAILVEYALAAAILIPVVIAAFYFLSASFRQREVKAFEGMKQGSIPASHCTGDFVSDDCF